VCCHPSIRTALQVVAVEPGSDAARLGVCRGWMLHAVNGDVVCTAFAMHMPSQTTY
jgi:hypothetical protein